MSSSVSRFIKAPNVLFIFFQFSLFFNYYNLFVFNIGTISFKSRASQSYYYTLYKNTLLIHISAHTQNITNHHLSICDCIEFFLIILFRLLHVCDPKFLAESRGSFAVHRECNKIAILLKCRNVLLNVVAEFNKSVLRPRVCLVDY